MRFDYRECRSMRSNKSVYPCHISLPVPSPVSHISWYFLCSTIWCVLDRFVDIGGIVELLNFSFLVKIIQILPLVSKISNKKKEHILIKKIITLQTTSLSTKVGIRCLEIEHNNWSFLANISMEICVVKGLLSVVCLDQDWGHCFFFYHILLSSNCKIKATLLSDVCIIYWNIKHHHYSIALQNDLSCLAHNSKEHGVWSSGQENVKH